MIVIDLSRFVLVWLHSNPSNAHSLGEIEVKNEVNFRLNPLQTIWIEVQPSKVSLSLSPFFQQYAESPAERHVQHIYMLYRISKPSGALCLSCHFTSCWTLIYMTVFLVRWKSSGRNKSIWKWLVLAQDKRYWHISLPDLLLKKEQKVLRQSIET